MNQLVAIPRPGAVVSIDVIRGIEADIANRIASIEDLEALQELHAQVEAMERYLRGKELNGPMLGAQRRVEARIGQLLGHGERGRPKNGNPSTLKDFPEWDRHRFRVLARGLEHGLSEEEWRSPRDRLIKLIQQRFPMPRHVPTVVTEKGTKKSRTERIEEISTLAAEGYRAAQISEKIGCSEDRVREIAKAESIVLPDLAIGRGPKPDSKRILNETINGVEAYVSGLSMLEALGLPELTVQEQLDLMQTLARAINGLRKLRTQMEKQYAGSNATAA